jgi:hypothetical protein
MEHVLWVATIEFVYIVGSCWSSKCELRVISIMNSTVCFHSRRMEMNTSAAFHVSLRLAIIEFPPPSSYMPYILSLILRDTGRLGQLDMKCPCQRRNPWCGVQNAEAYPSAILMVFSCSRPVQWISWLVPTQCTEPHDKPHHIRLDETGNNNNNNNNNSHAVLSVSVTEHAPTWWSYLFQKLTVAQLFKFFALCATERFITVFKYVTPFDQMNPARIFTHYAFMILWRIWPFARQRLGRRVPKRYMNRSPLLHNRFWLPGN